MRKMDAASSWDLWAPMSGLIFAVSFMVLFFAFLGPGELPANVNAAQIAGYYQGRGGPGFLLMYSLIGLSGTALLYFFGIFIWVLWVLMAGTLLLTRPVGRASLGVRASAPPPQALDVVP